MLFFFFSSPSLLSILKADLFFVSVCGTQVNVNTFSAAITTPYIWLWA